MPTALQHGYCDFAQYDGVGRARASLSSGTLLPSFPKYLSNWNAVIPGVAAESKHRHSCSTRRTQTSSFPAVPSAPKLRHSARSRGIHLRLPTHQAEKPVPSALQYGYCDFAQYDGVGRARASPSSGTLLPSFPKYPPNWNAVIPGVAAESKRRHSAQCPLHPNFVIPRAVAESISALPTHQPEKPAPSALHHGYCDFAQYDGVGRARASLSSGTLLPSFPKCLSNPNTVILVVPAEPKLRHSPQCPLHPNFVIPRAVAESIFACQRISQRSQCPLHSTMDTATSRSMTVLVGQGRLCPLALFCRHSRSSCRTQTPSFL